MNEEVSKSSLAVIMILTLLVSVLSTITILKSMEDMNLEGKPAEIRENTGQVRLSIDNPQKMTGSGQVSLSIKRVGDN